VHSESTASDLHREGVAHLLFCASAAALFAVAVELPNYAGALGLDTYHVYDSSIPLVEVQEHYEYGAVLERIIEAVAPLGADYQALIQREERAPLTPEELIADTKDGIYIDGMGSFSASAK